VLRNVPQFKEQDGLVDSGTIENHNYFYWSYVEASPFDPALRNLPMRYETDLYFMVKRLHAHNIMHNLHDDVIGLFHLLKQYVGKGSYEYEMPFSLDAHRLMLLDIYQATDSTRPFYYLSNHPLRFLKYLKTEDTSVITCFRDAGTSFFFRLCGGARACISDWQFQADHLVPVRL
jgi:protein O-mannose beta-1,4-N-acetylglucosaminyltransferase